MILILTPFYRWGNWSSEGWSHFAQGTQKSVAVLGLNLRLSHPELPNPLPSKARQLGLLTANTEFLFFKYHPALKLLTHLQLTAPLLQLLLDLFVIYSLIWQTFTESLLYSSTVPCAEYVREAKRKQFLPLQNFQSNYNSIILQSNRLILVT